MNQATDEQEIDAIKKQFIKDGKLILEEAFTLGECTILARQRMKGVPRPNGQSQPGVGVRSQGYGKSAGKHVIALEKYIENPDGSGDMAPGLNVSHQYYVDFLRHFYALDEADDSQTAASEADDSKPAASVFNERYSHIWAESADDERVGIASTKNTNNQTKEPCVTSLLAGLITSYLGQMPGEQDEWSPYWCAEFPMYGSGADKSKVPRLDGLLVMPGPLDENVLLPLVAMKAKLNDFTREDKLQATSNAIDA